MNTDPEETESPAADSIRVITKWDDFDLTPDLLRGIYCNGFEVPSSIQQKAILPIMQGRDVIGQAQSGSGKTGAFCIGTLQRIDLTLQCTQAIILAPTHELVKQIESVFSVIGSKMVGLTMRTMLGGTSVSDDMNDLRRRPPHIIVGCTGRVMDMLSRRAIDPSKLKIIVMDEADEMLADGFKDTVYRILRCLPQNVQVALFSATMAEEIISVANTFMRSPASIVMKAEALTLDCIQQFYMEMYTDSDKFSAVTELFSKLIVSQCIIYVNSVNRVIDLHNSLMRDGFSVGCIHSSMRKDERESALSEFRKGAFRVLISSNITARGIDVQQVSTVINFDIPRDVNTYLHRIGRSGRWGRKGLAINFMMSGDVSNMKYIEKHFGIVISKFPESFNFVM
jgi:translation initiation factor 4A